MAVLKQSGELLDALGHAEKAIMEAVLTEDGLDGDHGIDRLREIASLLIMHKRDSAFSNMPKEEV